MTPPIRFLVMVSCGWVGLRTALLLLPGPAAPTPGLVRKSAPRLPQWQENTRRPVVLTEAPQIARASQGTPMPGAPLAQTGAGSSGAPVSVAAVELVRFAPPPGRLPVASSISASAAPLPIMPALPPVDSAPGPRRWSASVWMLLREGKGLSPVPGGTLGGSQMGARISYRLNNDAGKPLRVFTRVYAAPAQERVAAEGAIGLEWQPVPALPLAVAVERRQALDGDGRSAWAVFAYGGTTQRAGSFQLDAYAQAGVVGVEARDLFADGAVRVTKQVGPVDVGAGAWGAAQRDTARLDVGPSLSLPLQVGGANLRLSADWRFRVAGDAQPGSGPTLSLGADF